MLQPSSTLPHNLNNQPYGCIDGQPIIETDRVEGVGGGTYQAIIETCPICGETHRHGFLNGVSPMTKGQSTPTHKSAHCNTPSPMDGGYYIIFTDATIGVEFSEAYNGWAATDAIKEVE